MLGIKVRVNDYLKDDFSLGHNFEEGEIAFITEMKLGHYTKQDYLVQTTSDYAWLTREQFDIVIEGNGFYYENNKEHKGGS